MNKTVIKQSVQIKAPNFKNIRFKIKGTSPLVQNKFSTKARNMMMEKQKEGSTAKGKKKREAKNFEKCFKESQHISTEGWNGIPAGAFRAAMISACRLVQFTMSRSKLSIFIVADGYDEDGMGLIRITKGKPHMHICPVRIRGTADIRARAMWDAGWEANLLIQHDADMLSSADITNLLRRAGLQVGICEGRPDSKDSVGMGWGTFDIIND
ncbi:hypothetical protein COS78_00275 [Candidatus Shapirobacteria bacterium CG06_land_8_20_14_3_00_40_12]|uniref:Uncharacterized protein n=1 Tax=Candidatus Shapirobacteria bacterium CG06_land_8_20_14_3_00_40_12 TaxID=1974881 RepID=A0A2M7ATA4_9BACT|nr:MAG: hypothetical protein COS78_00275 [Candidatus Shapirobacteria bacterium CG06_land_8_20_14_3_00_40_12]